MKPPERILVFQTAFLGDVILTLPMLQVLRSRFPQAHIACVTIPASAPLLMNHPAVNHRIEFDKRGRHRGVAGVVQFSQLLKRETFDLAIVPHRSIRSAAVVRMAGVPRRIGFSTSAVKVLFTDIVTYDPQAHEILRNLSLLRPLGIDAGTVEKPALYPDAGDKKYVDEFFGTHKEIDARRLVGIAPGSVWNTKRWPREKFVELVRLLDAARISVVIIGGEADKELANEVVEKSGAQSIINAAGRLSLLQSAELIRRCQVVVSNDSAPMHMAVAMGTPVVAIFGATVPEFGFAPVGERDIVVQTSGLTCRPCSIHGGKKCPIETFVCMKNITPEEVLKNVHALITEGGVRH